MMSTATQRVRRRPLAPAIAQPGRNCWRVERAYEFHCIQDGADYFRLVRDALLNAHKTIFILGWDIFAEVDLLPSGTKGLDGPKGPALRRDEAPTRLDELLDYVAQRRPDLRCYILIWDYAALYTLERDPWSRWKLGWRSHRRIRFGFDDNHPMGGSHHQKIVVVDDSLAFCGGIDLTSHRWDTQAHRVHEPARINATGTPYGPYHEIQAMVSGPAAASLGVLARDRWRALGEKRIPPINRSTDDLWPADLLPDLTYVDVTIARTMPASPTQPAIRECEALFLDSIAHATQSIYIESQYFTNEALATALGERLQERNGPEVIVVTPAECDGWLERNTMGSFRHDVFRHLIDADRYKRLRLVYPSASRTQNVPTFVHSKVMIVDDTLARIGSANFSRRSMGVDSECDLAVEARGESRVRSGIRRIRDRLLAEHLALPVESVSRALADSSLRALIDARADADHTLVRIDLGSGQDETSSEALRAVADPGEPIAFGSAGTELVPPARGTSGVRRMPFPILPGLVVAIVAAAATLAAGSRPELRAAQDVLEAIPDMTSMLWFGIVAFVLANLALIPLELMVFGAGLLFGAMDGGVIALLGSLAAAIIGYGIGRVMGSGALVRWMSRRSYRSTRQFGAHSVMGVVILRLASVASAGSIHLLCGAGRVPFVTYLAGTLIGLVPMIAGLAALGALLRQTLLEPSIANGLLTVGGAILLTAGAVLLRTFLLVRQFAPSVSNQRVRAEFG
jgi:phospholipase D1/2